MRIEAGHLVTSLERDRLRTLEEGPELTPSYLHRCYTESLPPATSSNSSSIDLLLLRLSLSTRTSLLSPRSSLLAPAHPPQILSKEKARNLSGNQDTSAPHKEHAPGWNEHLAVSRSVGSVRLGSWSGPAWLGTDRFGLV
jgi:hypothetical protein